MSKPYPGENLDKIFDFLQLAEKLKSTTRYLITTTGRQESTAEHSWRLALMAFMIISELKLDLDLNKSLKLALVHDLAEAITGDIDALIVAKGEVSKVEKEALEIQAIAKMQATLPSHLGQEISELWHEYNDHQTPEAKFIKALDKIETLTQFCETGNSIYDDVDFIANYADKAVNNFPALKNLLKVVKKRLKIEYEKGGFEWKPEYDTLE